MRTLLPRSIPALISLLLLPLLSFGQQAGTLDATFNSSTGANSDVETIAVQADGKIIIGGFFTSYNGTSRNRIARLNADGSLDATFNPGTGASGNSSYFVQTTALQADGEIIIGDILLAIMNFLHLTLLAFKAIVAQLQLPQPLQEIQPSARVVQLY